MKRFNYYLALFALLPIAGGIYLWGVRNRIPQIQTFEICNYQYYIDNFPEQEKVEPVSDIADLLKSVEEIWLRKYGVDIKKQKPYQVFYDNENEVWLVTGSVRPITEGGVAYILIDGITGDVLAVWHDK